MAPSALASLEMHYGLLDGVGLSSSATSVCSLAMTADVVDEDELGTGRRREGLEERRRERDESVETV
jgi:Na+/melibiose symporter-like transporter